MIRFAVLAVLTLILASCHDDEANDRAYFPESELDQNETVLPAGVRETWFAALDEAIKKNIVLYRGRVRMSGEFGSVSYVPVADIRPVCGGFLYDISLKLAFGGEEASSFGVDLVGGFGHYAFGGPKPVPAPELGVNEFSPAAMNLMDDLCRRLLDR